jgi:hypothetical protein
MDSITLNNFSQTSFSTLNSLLEQTLAETLPEINALPALSFSNYETVVYNFLMEKYISDAILLDSDTKKIDYIYILHSAYKTALSQYRTILKTDTISQSTKMISPFTKKFLKSKLVLRVEFHQQDSVLKYLDTLYKTFLAENKFIIPTVEIVSNNLKELVTDGKTLTTDNWLTYTNIDRLIKTMTILNYFTIEKDFNEYFTFQESKIKDYIASLNDILFAVTNILVSKQIDQEALFLKDLRLALVDKYHHQNNLQYFPNIITLEDLLMNRLQMETIEVNNMSSGYLEIVCDDFSTIEYLFPSLDSSEFSVSLRMTDYNEGL